VVPSIFGFPRMSSVVLRIDRKYFANDPSGSVDQLIDAEAARLDAYLRSVPDALAQDSQPTNEISSVAGNWPMVFTLGCFYPNMPRL